MIVEVAQGGKYHPSVVPLLLCALRHRVTFPAGHKLRTLAFPMADNETQWEQGGKHQRKAQNKEGSLFHQKHFFFLATVSKIIPGLYTELEIS